MNTLVFDIGKTHVKLHLLDVSLKTLAVEKILNRPLAGGSYPAADVDGLWDWLLQKLRSLQLRFGINKISITTHGATAALIDREQGGNGLVLPVLDYEFPGVESTDGEYNSVRPGFEETGSPSLPAGLNLGRQLFWLWKFFPDEFSKATDILLYPQYWVWRLTGYCFSEVTSLGCHTDLWAPWRNDFSSLVTARRWSQKFPPLKNAWDVAGVITSELSAATGLPESCEVYVGVHDSNASYLRYKTTLAKPFTIASTGTWSIVMNGFAASSALQDRRDMLVNVDVYGEPVICSRFMGGREYGLICEKLNGDLDALTGQRDIVKIIDQGVYCLPAWQAGTGPFGSHSPAMIGELDEDVPPAALATLYCALMLDYQLDLVQSSDAVIISGAFLKNSLLCQLLAQLRADQQCLASRDVTGTVMGAAQLCRWNQSQDDLALDSIEPSSLARLDDYRNHWRELCDTHF